jgi:hypothetical protein
MAREIIEQKEERRIRLRAEEDARIAEYRKTIPQRMMEAQALANNLNIRTEVTLIKSGPEITFFQGQGLVYECGISYDTEEWELTLLEEKLKELKQKEEAKIIRYKQAQDAFNSLTPDQKQAVKEFIYFLV